jgi:hypothetical protein
MWLPPKARNLSQLFNHPKAVVTLLRLMEENGAYEKPRNWKERRPYVEDEAVRRTRDKENKKRSEQSTRPRDGGRSEAEGSRPFRGVAPTPTLQVTTTTSSHVLPLSPHRTG